MLASPLRRRAQLLEPLDPPASLTAEEEIEEIEDSLLQTNSNYDIFDHYVSPCQFRVSNDPLLVSEPEDVCDATIYGCVRDHTFLLNSNDNVKELALRYDYDMYYDPYDSQMRNVQDMIEFLEGTMLEHLASLLDLKQCPPLSSLRSSSSSTSSNTARNNDGPSQRRRATTSDIGRRVLQEFSDEQSSVVIAINSQPGDLKSAEYECISPPEDGAMCQSMVGLMTVYLENARVSDADESAIANAAYRVIRTGMEAGTYSKGAIQSLTFIGDRSTPAPTNATVVATASPVTVTNDIVVTPSPVPATNAPVATTPPGTMGTPDEPVLAPGLSPVSLDNAVVAVSKGEPIVNNGDSLGGTQIGLISAASAFLVVVALLGLLVSKKRRRIETLDEDDGALDGSRRSVSSKGSPPRTRTIFPALVPQWSREGAEIPGSLASQDAMALKPQYRRSDDNSCASSDSEREEEPVLQTPPRITNVALQESSSSQEVALDTGVVQNTVPLSPVKNSKSGTSPSQVSPKRLPASLNAPFVSSRGASSTSKLEHHRSVAKAPSQSMSILDQLVAEIDAETGSPPRTRGNTIETLQRIAYDDSGSTASFQDTVSGDSRHPGHSVVL